MKKLLPIFLLASNTFVNVLAQAPLVKIWDHRYGTTVEEYNQRFQQTADGGYIIGGDTKGGISGDKSQPNWDVTLSTPDLWIVKTNSIGNLEWEKRFGGNSYEEFCSLRQTTDGGYILGSMSLSGNGGDKTQPNWGDFDYWIVKTDSLGNKLWDKRFGGFSTEILTSIQQTFDGGYILGGSSTSAIGGDRTQTSRGYFDYWIVKIDSLGNKQWDKRFGGYDGDILQSLQQTMDGGYILCGQSSSGLNGDKSQPNFGLSTTSDYWIVKIDSVGNKLWDKIYGGSEEEYCGSIFQTPDKGYLMGGISSSGISGNKSTPLWGVANHYDIWIVRIDSIGNILWDRDFGGIDQEEFSDLKPTSDGGYILSGDSYSPISGDKTESNLGFEQTWILKMDSIGNKIWDKTIFTIGHDEGGYAIQTTDGCYAILNGSFADAGGYKSQNTQGSFDFWLVKFCETIEANLTANTNLCPGTCTDFLNLSFNAITYQWSFPGASPDTSTATNPTNICYTNPGTYDVQLIAYNPTGSDTLLLANYITVYPTPPSQGITQSGDTLFANQGSAIYQWYFNANAIAGATNYFYIATQSGNYSVVATDANGCEVEAVINNVIAHTPLAAGYLPLAVYPNPVTEMLSVNRYSLSGTAATISIYNSLGVMAIQLSTCNPQTIVDCNQLSPGIYWIEISQDSSTYRTRFIKN